MLKTLSALIAGSEAIETIGVVLDADNPSLSSKWVSLKNRLEKEGYDVPENPTQDGTIVDQQDKPKVGVWLMPDNNVDGMLEDFCHRLAPELALDFAQECVSAARKKNFSSFIGNHFSKAVIHTLLAWQNEPGMPLGQAITAKALDGSQPIANNFSNFLKRLF